MSMTTEHDHILSNSTYDKIKHLAQIGLPATGTLYFAISQIWGLPYGEQVVGTIVAIDAFLGILLGYSSVSYNKSQSKYDGFIEITQQDDKKVYSLNLNTPPEELGQKASVNFKIESGEF